MRITIIIPVYNSAEYILDCLKSVIEQTYCGELECILVDDCGTDESISIINTFISNYHGNVAFRILHHKINRGAAAARNTGLDAATGDLVFFLDSDDWLSPICFEKMTAILAKYPDVDMVHAGIITTDGSIPWFDFEKNHFPEYTDDRYEIKVNLLGREILPATPYAKLLRSNFLKDNGIYFHEGIVIEDVLWCNKLAKYVKSIACLSINTYYYRIHEGSIVTSGLGVDPRRRLIVYNLMIDTIDEPYKKEQVVHLLNQLDKIYFENNLPEIRYEVGQLLMKLSRFISYPLKIRIILRSICARLNKGNCFIAYYFYNQLAMNDSLIDIFFRIVKRIFRR